MLRFWRSRSHRPLGSRHPTGPERLEARDLLSFLPPVSYNAGEAPQAATAGDFNGDGRPDLVVANYTESGTLSVLMGNGDGTFRKAVTLEAGRFPFDLATGDLNHDGADDIVTSGQLGVAAWVLLSNGDGTFQGRRPVGSEYGTDPVLRDFDGDANLDLAVNSFIVRSEVDILLGNGDGTFRSAAGYAFGLAPVNMQSADLNGDGYADLLAENLLSFNVTVVLNAGDGSFGPPQTYQVTTNVISTVLTGDLNGDGLGDLVTVARGFPARLSVLLNNGDGTFPAPTYSETGPLDVLTAIADFNLDGNLDLVALGQAFGVHHLLGNGDGTFRKPWLYAFGGLDYRMAVSDLNGDGYPDAAAASPGLGTVLVLLNDTYWNDLQAGPGRSPENPPEPAAPAPADRRREGARPPAEVVEVRPARPGEEELRAHAVRPAGEGLPWDAGWLTEDPSLGSV